MQMTWSIYIEYIKSLVEVQMTLSICIEFNSFFCTYADDLVHLHIIYYISCRSADDFIQLHRVELNIHPSADDLIRLHVNYDITYRYFFSSVQIFHANGLSHLHLNIWWYIFYVILVFVSYCHIVPREIIGWHCFNWAYEWVFLVKQHWK